ncbi:peptide ABC transporter substrate-binding protein [Pseudoclavibacter sp. RFBJ3]|uniref:ABC transporter substrate-binding protein n=1 Tax=unclassified Pseudoclavibacter TaxID=2615177 RepID=UPI000CE844A6|nr:MULTISPECIES: ABC transporter substrate-binding protein [unclassified Pseudoclavibacter]PPF80308.1 peptide ABC transporter substrate-binding protein [Pseudoclavibacter sp. RFBJ5]PPF89224.1 peptide ABC transporter substrate-binding protein [Pseudoclavibacter sp. RFBJ3]PPF95761.1 peptide ABC transporter substrate-binding protein [Pseudoclavibacter sp. RFBH5]PPG25912.1 peptide ABC transporter substrate-binding protein [Pseudoclavibacter sp. RFBI4]
MSTRHPRLRRKLAAAIGVLASMSFLAACATSDAAPGAAGEGEPKNGGDVTFLIDSLGDSWIPNNSAISSYQGHVWGHVTDKLVYVDGEGNVSPWVAESWDQNDDATEYTLHLKDGVTFSDGTPVDAAAVVANLDIWAKGDPDRGINRIGLFPAANYDGATAVDAATVEVKFSKPTLGFIPTLGYHGSILTSPAVIALPAEEQADLSNFVGSGPFTVESWQEGQDVVLTKREDYTWGPEALEHTGPAFLDSITYQIVAEPSLRTSSVQAGQADVAYNTSPQELDALADEGLEVAVPRYLGFVNGYALNTQVAPFDETEVRQAFQHGIDRDEILSTVYTEDWEAAESFIQSNVPEATDHSDAFAFDPEESKKLLDAAGWTAGADGIRSKNGETLAVTLYPNPYLATSQSVDELVAQQLKKVGFDVKIEAYDVVTYGERVLNSGVEIQATEITRSFIDVGTVAGILTSLNEGDEDWFGVGTSDTKLNEYAEGISSSSDTEARAALADELQGYVLEQGYFAPITQIVQRVYVQSPNLHGVTYNGVAYANYATAWVD